MLSKLKRAYKYCRFYFKSNYFKLVNEGEIHFMGFVDIGSQVTIRVPRGGRLRVGKNTAILQNTFIHASGKLDIGENVLINRNCYLACMDTMNIADFVMIADTVSIHDNDHELITYENIPRINSGFSTKPVYIDKNVWLSSKVTVLKGVRIGYCSVVVAGGVVTKDVPACWVYVGVPAKALKEIDECACAEK